jgi:hypothetical protein
VEKQISAARTTLPSPLIIRFFSPSLNLPAGDGNVRINNELAAGSILSIIVKCIEQEYDNK